MKAIVSKKWNKNIEEIPEVGDLTKIYFYVSNNDISSRYFNILKGLTNVKDDIISNWLNINARTFRNYKNVDLPLKYNTKEHVVLLIAIFKHGQVVFDGKEMFDNWLVTGNTMLDMKAPKDFLDTISGLKFIDDKLTALEYGDNV
jgi:uncharacterized protein (DUF2384 family)